MYVGVLPGRASVRIHSTTCCRHAARRRFTRSDRHDGQGDVCRRTGDPVTTDGAVRCTQATRGTHGEIESVECIALETWVDGTCRCCQFVIREAIP